MTVGPDKLKIKLFSQSNFHQQQAVCFEAKKRSLSLCMLRFLKQKTTKIEIGFMSSGKVI